MFDQRRVSVDLSTLRFPLSALIKEVENEIKMRRSVYANRVGHQRMTQSEADRKIAKMEDVRALLMRMAE